MVFYIHDNIQYLPPSPHTHTLTAVFNFDGFTNWTTSTTQIPPLKKKYPLCIISVLKLAIIRRSITQISKLKLLIIEDQYQKCHS